MVVNAGWQLDFCAGFIVPKCKGSLEEQIAQEMRGSAVELNDDLNDYFLPMFEISDADGFVDIVFSSECGEHPIQDLLQRIAFGPDSERLDCSKELAVRLASVTDRRSDEGLFILLLGHNEDRKRIAIWKFPNDESLHASFGEHGISIELLQDAFSRDNKYFKAAIFEGASSADLWNGIVEDKQATSRVTGVSDLWLSNFLQAQYELRDKAASAVLARALRETANRTRDPNLQEEINSVAVMLHHQDGQLVTFGEVQRRLPVEARATFEQVLNDDRLDVPFKLRSDVVEQLLRLRVIILDNGVSVRGRPELFAPDGPIVVHELEGMEIEISVYGTKVADKLGVR